MFDKICMQIVPSHKNKRVTKVVYSLRS